METTKFSAWGSKPINDSSNILNGTHKADPLKFSTWRQVYVAASFQSSVILIIVCDISQC